MAILTDVTRCIDCEECVQACKNVNHLGDEKAYGWQRDATDLSSERWTTIVRGPRGRSVRLHCCHCREPACASACPVGALRRSEYGAVTYDAPICMGCRYCMVACPFLMTRHEWTSPTPRVRKCILCFAALLQGCLAEPACTASCRPRRRCSVSATNFWPRRGAASRTPRVPTCRGCGRARGRRHVRPSHLRRRPPHCGLAARPAPGIQVSWLRCGGGRSARGLRKAVEHLAPDDLLAASLGAVRGGVVRVALPHRAGAGVRSGGIRGHRAEAHPSFPQALHASPGAHRHRPVDAAPVLPGDALRHQPQPPSPAVVVADPAGDLLRFGGGAWSGDGDVEECDQLLLFRRYPEWPLLAGLPRAASWVLGGCLRGDGVPSVVGGGPARRRCLGSRSGPRSDRSRGGSRPRRGGPARTGEGSRCGDRTAPSQRDRTRWPPGSGSSSRPFTGRRRGRHLGLVPRRQRRRAVRDLRARAAPGQAGWAGLVRAVSPPHRAGCACHFVRPLPP